MNEWRECQKVFLLGLFLSLYCRECKPRKVCFYGLYSCWKGIGWEIKAGREGLIYLTAA